MFTLYRRLVLLLSLPVLLSGYFRRETGHEYRMGFAAKLRLAWRMRQNTQKIRTASSFLEHLLMAAAVLQAPKSAAGCLVECGSYKGGSTANLSLVAARCGRRLEVFDSFAGLPEPAGRDKRHTLLHEGQIHTYRQGAYCGTLEEVKQNISAHGAIEACEFHPGFFAQTLAGFRGQCVFAFLDVDLRDSLEVCVKYLWPRLSEGSYLFTHEAEHLEIASLFFDDGWWRQNLNCDAPGLIGAGSGLGLFPSDGCFASNLGYTIKGGRELREMPG
ncbi:MAG TPA: TylF/MycF/NovP-related O-methyltransferase [Bryobacterales bacterium]|nr:TylF/MycF/NovP-related O-methyltransferase [Bryobacterales bacterium]